MMRWRDDRGSATVAAALVCVAIIGLAIAFVYVGSAVSARHRVQAAADLAALAAAADLSCGAAEMIAGGDGGGAGGLPDRR